MRALGPETAMARGGVDAAVAAAEVALAKGSLAEAAAILAKGTQVRELLPCSGWDRLGKWLGFM